MMQCVDALLSLYLRRSLTTSDSQVTKILAPMQGRSQPRSIGGEPACGMWAPVLGANKCLSFPRGVPGVATPEILFCIV